MAQKKRKRHGPKPSANPQMLKTAEEQDRQRRRLRPAARNLLFLDLIFLAVCELLVRNDILSETIAAACSVLGFVALLVALGIQFNVLGKGRSSGGTRL